MTKRQIFFSFLAAIAGLLIGLTLLVIGNAAYEGNSLVNPVNDAPSLLVKS